MAAPRVVIAALLFNHGREVREALESVLAQTYTDFALLLVDDVSSDETPEIAREYAAIDARVSYHRNPARLGLIDNSQHGFRLARELHPEAEYFAWASDHDLWHPGWLAAMVAALDGNRDAVLAYPLNRRIDERGAVIGWKKPWVFETAGVASRWERMSRSIRGMSAGNMVYGLFRAEALGRAGIYRHALVPDRLLFTELSLYGQFVQVPQVLWFRRSYGKLFSLSRQRVSFFPGKRPLYAYAPWWISHPVSLFWTFAVRGAGLPEISRGAGVRAAIQCLLSSGVLHAVQRVRERRTSFLANRQGLRTLDARVRLKARDVRKRMGKKTTHYQRRAKHLATQVLRHPWTLGVKAFRALPLVRSRFIPSLLKQELDQIPAAPIASELRKELQRLQRTKGPILIGPWISEVGFEVLYWIPFLNWAIRSYGLDQRRLVVVSRGGARPWYHHLTREYVDVFDLYSIEEYRQANEERWHHAGNQKQYDVSEMDREILDRARARLSLGADVEILHPSLMYRLLRFYWYEKAGVALLTKHTEYRRMAPTDATGILSQLPRDYVAVRFYFRPSFPDTPENRAFAASVIRGLSRHTAVVLLNTGLNLDDHADVSAEAGKGVYRVEQLMTPQHNLDVQTQIISHARAFVGTYGGLAYVGPFYGVPSIGFYSDESELIPAHLDIGWRLGRTVGHPAVAVDVREADLLRVALAGTSEDGAAAAVTAAISAAR